MDNSDKGNFAQLLIGVASTYGKEINEYMINTYWSVLKKYDWFVVKEAFITHLEDGLFMPKIAEIRRIIAGNDEEKAQNAWETFDRAVRYNGPYQSINFDDPIISVVINELGGWSRFSKINDYDYRFCENEFKKKYLAKVKKKDFLERKLLLGIEALSNLSTGYELPTPVLVSSNNITSQMLICSSKED